MGALIDVYGAGYASRDSTYFDMALDIRITAMKERMVIEGESRIVSARPLIPNGFFSSTNQLRFLT